MTLLDLVSTSSTITPLKSRSAVTDCASALSCKVTQTHAYCNSAGSRRQSHTVYTSSNPINGEEYRAGTQHTS